VTVIASFGMPPPPTAIAEAAGALGEGWPVGIPTDTVYGLAADPFCPGATDRVFAAKGRPRGVTLPVLVAGLEQALELADAVSEGGLALMRRYWPGPLTVVVARRAGLAADLGEDESTVGVRCPAHPVARALCTVAGPLAVTSANLHGGEPLVTAAAVDAAFAGLVPVVLDGGACTGHPSTVVDCTDDEPRLIRRGAVSWAEVIATLSGPGGW